MSFQAAEISRSQLGQCPSAGGLSVIRGGKEERVTLLPSGSSISAVLNIRRECMGCTVGDWLLATFDLNQRLTGIHSIVG